MKTRAITGPLLAAWLSGAIGCASAGAGDAGPAKEAGKDPTRPATGAAQSTTGAAQSTTGAAQSTTGTPQGADAKASPVRSAANVYFVGHSLVNHVMPEMLLGIARGHGVQFDYDCQVKNGTNLKMQWEDDKPGEGRAADGQGGRPSGGGQAPARAKEALATGKFDVVVLTELAPPINHIQWSCSAGYALEFYNLAVHANPNAQVYLYEIWGKSREPKWREEIASNRKLVEEYVIDAVNEPTVPVKRPPGAGNCPLKDPPAKREPGKPMLVVPAGRALAMLDEQIEAGQVPGVTSRAQLFVDDMHLTELGNYFVALVFYATIYGRDPRGAITSTRGEWGRTFAPVSRETADRFAEVAWAAVRAEPRSGVR